ncbi:MAG: pseudouridine synthase [Chroococcales cyanobacterium]
MEERIQKILSQWGIASRRHAEKLILAGRVRVNGNQVDLGEKANPNCDRIEVDGKVIQPANRPNRISVLVNKPIGVVSTCHDPQHRRTVVDLLPPSLSHGQGIHPVGRLDINSTGALLLTNDGDLTLCLTHPRYHLPKTYQVWVEGRPPEMVLEQWRKGVILDGKPTLPASVKLLKQKDNKALLEIILTEGRNRQIRRVADQLGFRVLKLHRQAIGPIQLQPPNGKPLPSGHYRFLTDLENRFLQNQIDQQFKKVSAERKENFR